MSNSKQFSKIQELVYELRIGTVMKRKVISVSPNTMMSELRTILKDNRISGTPVVEDQRIVGIVSVEDFIKWLSGGGRDLPVRERMSRRVVTLYEDEPLLHAISSMEEHGFGRFPVLERKSGRPVGMMTKGDIIEGLLHKIEVDYHEEEIHHYRASHFFEDILADKITLIFQYRVKSKEIQQGGQVASELKKSFKRLGIHPDIVRRAAILTYEAEMNIIIYAKDGLVTVRVDPDNIAIDIADKGPGIPDVEQALKPGYSTAPDWVRELGFGAGMGLDNIKKCAGTFHISSVVGQGTLLKINIPREKKCA